MLRGMLLRYIFFYPFERDPSWMTVGKELFDPPVDPPIS